MPPVPKKKKSKYPADMDPECIPLCEALNAIPGVTTISSCFGHGWAPFGIFFTVDTFDALEEVAWWTHPGHSGLCGWSAKALSQTVQGRPPMFLLEGPIASSCCSLCRRSVNVAKEAKQLADAMSGRVKPPYPW